MFGDKREDDFNAWIHNEAKQRGLNIKYHPTEECFMIFYEHTDSSSPVENIDEVKELIDYANSQGYKCRYWLEEITTERHHHHLASIICFCYNG